MADPRDVVPYDDPDDAAFAENILRFLDESNPTLEDLPPPQPISRQPGSVEVGGVSDPNTGAGSSGAGPSEFRAGTTSRKRAHVETESSREGRPLPTWPPEPIPFNCSCCQVLREIIYTNGTHLRHCYN